MLYFRSMKHYRHLNRVKWKYFQLICKIIMLNVIAIIPIIPIIVLLFILNFIDRSISTVYEFLEKIGSIYVDRYRNISFVSKINNKIDTFSLNAVRYKRYIRRYNERNSVTKERNSIDEL